MDKTDLEIHRLHCQVVALETVVAMILKGLAGLPNVKEAIVQKLDQLPETIEQVSFPELGPERSDMMSAELRDAAEELADFLKSRLEK